MMCGIQNDAATRDGGWSDRRSPRWCHPAVDSGFDHGAKVTDPGAAKIDLHQDAPE
jgi:hypothetical protein